MVANVDVSRAQQPKNVLCQNIRSSLTFRCVNCYKKIVLVLVRTVGLCSGLFLSMLLINSFLQFLFFLHKGSVYFMKRSAIMNCLYKLSSTHSEEEYTCGSGEMVDLLILFMSPAMSCLAITEKINNIGRDKD